MLYRELLATCSEHHTKGINTLEGKYAEFLNVKHRWYTYSYRQALEKLINQTTNQSTHYREFRRLQKLAVTQVVKKCSFSSSAR
jgi:hypothetical protein